MGSIGAYVHVSEHGPGNPLFPSKFAQPTVGLTLRANNPALRSLKAPPAPAYPFMRQLEWARGWEDMGMGNRGPPS